MHIIRFQFTTIYKPKSIAFSLLNPSFDNQIHCQDINIVTSATSENIPSFAYLL